MRNTRLTNKTLKTCLSIDKKKKIETHVLKAKKSIGQDTVPMLGLGNCRKLHMVLALSLIAVYAET